LELVKGLTINRKPSATRSVTITSLLGLLLFVVYGLLQPALSGSLPTKQDDKPVPQESGELHYGLLTEISPDRYQSPAGLLYTPGSEEGHRLKHVQRHTEDMPQRPGSHGVFDGGMEGALKAIDTAYVMVKEKKSGVQKEENGSRTIYTINMGTRIGYVGGREGNRRKRPMARRLRLVVEGNRVITAFPL
jgi:hypothetical protein